MIIVITGHKINEIKKATSVRYYHWKSLVLDTKYLGPIGMITETVYFNKEKLIRSNHERPPCPIKFFKYRRATPQEEFLYYLHGQHILEEECL